MFELELRLEKLWIRNVAITTGLASTNTMLMLLKTVQAKRLQPSQLITHRFPLQEIMKAYDVFKNAGKSMP